MRIELIATKVEMNRSIVNEGLSQCIGVLGYSTVQ